MKGHPATNRFRSGSKNPEREVLVTELEDGTYAVTVADWKNARITHEVVGQPLTNPEDSDNIEDTPVVDSGSNRQSRQVSQ